MGQLKSTNNREYCLSSFYRASEKHNGNEIYRFQINKNTWEKMEISMKDARNFHDVIDMESMPLDCTSGLFFTFEYFLNILMIKKMMLQIGQKVQ